MGELRNQANGGSQPYNWTDGSWIANAINRGNGSLGIPAGTGTTPATPATPDAAAAPSGAIPTSFFGKMVYNMAQQRHANGAPTPLGDHMGWFGDPTQAQGQANGNPTDYWWNRPGTGSMGVTEAPPRNRPSPITSFLGLGPNMRSAY